MGNSVFPFKFFVSHCVVDFCLTQYVAHGLKKP